MENLKRVKEKLSGIKVARIGYGMVQYLTENKKVIKNTLQEIVLPETQAGLREKILDHKDTVLVVNNKNERFIINLVMKLYISIDFAPNIDYKQCISIKRATL